MGDNSDMPHPEIQSKDLWIVLAIAEVKLPSRRMTLGAFFLNRLARAGPVGAAPTTTNSNDSRCFGVTSDEFVRKDRRGGATFKKVG